MEGLDKKQTWLRRNRLLLHLLFWVLMYAYYIGSHWAYYPDKQSLFEKFFAKTALQIPLSYFIALVLVPRLLQKGRWLAFLLTSLLSVYLIFILYTFYRYVYFDVKFPGVYPGFSLGERLIDFNLFFNDLTWFVFPSVLLVAYAYYQDQKEMLQLREHKKSTELALLRNQLNPHFLFNTLNSLYILALKKSDQTPAVIAKLSAILDYLLYHCNDKFVSLVDEIKLLNNYIELEQLRYGKRLEISFDYKIGKGVMIAPLILLTFLENAFKHGVKEEINVANVEVNLKAKQEEILFELRNSKPQNGPIKETKIGESIGLQNIRKQLDLLYPQAYSLHIDEGKLDYFVQLKLMPHAL